MSTQTEHLGLHQWEAGDSFLRSDFNEDFAKIDAGVKAAHALAGAAQALAENVSVAGSYTVTDRKAFVLDFGWRPKLAIMATMKGTEYYLGVIVGNVSHSVYFSGTTGAFRVAGTSAALCDTGINIPENDYSFNRDAGREVFYVALR